MTRRTRLLAAALAAGFLLPSGVGADDSGGPPNEVGGQVASGACEGVAVGVDRTGSGSYQFVTVDGGTCVIDAAPWTPATTGRIVLSGAVTAIECPDGQAVQAVRGSITFSVYRGSELIDTFTNVGLSLNAPPGATAGQPAYLTLAKQGSFYGGGALRRVGSGHCGAGVDQPVVRWTTGTITFSDPTLS